MLRWQLLAAQHIAEAGPRYARSVLSPYRIAEECPAVAPALPQRDLGELRSKHDARPVFIVSLLAVVSVAFWAWIVMPRTCGGVPTALVVAIVGFGFVAIVFAAWTITQGGVYRLYDFGITRQSWLSERAIHFGDVRTVHYRNVSPWGPARKIEVVLIAGDSSRFAVPCWLDNASDIRRAIDVACVRPLLALAQRSLDTGERLSFGPIDLVANLIAIETGVFRWTELVTAELEVYSVRFDFGHRTVRVSLRDIAHARVLLILLARRGKLVGDPALLAS